jgi:hypothetical protein
VYIHSDCYGFEEKTNRHGILHGAYADADYDAPINFYKTIAAIDFLCFVAAFRARLPCLAPRIPALDVRQEADNPVRFVP